MDALINALKGVSQAQDASVAQPRFGHVTSVDAQLGTVRVEFQPEGVLSGWLPVLSHWVGSGWGLWSPPSPGDQVLVLPQEGDAENGVVIGSCWSDRATPPNAPVGELWIVHRSGAALKLLNDGSLLVTGDLRVNGDIYDRAGSVSSLRTHYNQHTHSDPQGGRTDLPSPQDGGASA